MSRLQRNILRTLAVLVIYVSVVYVLFWTESDKDGSNIKSFTDALWYSIITLTTIGYGDRFPVSDIGRIISLVFVLGSVGVLGFVISQISSKIYKIMEDKKLGYFGTKFENHVVLIHWNNFARQVLSEIVNAGKKAAVITNKKEDVDYIYEHYDKSLVYVLHSDNLDSTTFQRSNLASATTVLLNFEDDTENLVNLIALKSPFPNLSYVISLNNPSLKKTFKQLGVTFTLAKNEVASKLIASYVFEPDVARLTEGIMSSATAEEDAGLMQFLVTENNPYVSFKGEDLFIELKTKLNVVLMAISKRNNGEITMINVPTNNHVLEAGDYAIIFGNPQGKERVAEVFGVEEGI
jgi:voltage-gated potassium channel